MSWDLEQSNGAGPYRHQSSGWPRTRGVFGNWEMAKGPPQPAEQGLWLSPSCRCPSPLVPQFPPCSIIWGGLSRSLQSSGLWWGGRGVPTGTWR